MSIKQEMETVLRSGSGKEYERLLKSIVTAIRNVPEIKQWIKEKKDPEDTCRVCANVFKEYGVAKEFHHTPKTLFEIVDATAQRYATGKLEFSAIDIINDVVSQHLEDDIEGVVVCTCCHKQLHHERKIFGCEKSLP